MAEIASAFVSLLPSARGFGRGLEREIGPDIDKAGKNSGKRFGLGMATAALGALGGVAAIGTFLKGANDEAREAQKVGALTNNVIKQTGGIANVTAKQVGNLATAISNKTGVDDEAIQSGANLLLTFKNVRNEVGKNNDIFNRATQAAADLSAAGFGDMAGTSKQLGKALNDPVKGISALGRAGVTFTDQQKAQIKTLVTSGKTLLAQKIILGEVESQVGGAAAASATAGDKFKVAFGNMQEAVGTALLPAVDKVLGGMTKFAISITGKVGPAVASLGKFLSDVRATAGDLFAKLSSGGGKAFAAFGAGGKTIAAVKDSISTIGAALKTAFAGSGGGIGSLVSSFKTFGKSIAANIVPAAAKVGQVFRDVLLPAFTRLSVAVITNVVPVLKQASTTFRTVILPAVTTLVTYVASKVLPIFTALAAIFVTKVLPGVAAVAKFFYGVLYPAVVAIASSVAQNLKPVFDQLVATIKSNVLPTLTKILDRFHQWWPTIQKVVMVIVGLVGWLLKFAAVILGKVLPPLIRLIGFIISRGVPIVLNLVEAVAKMIGALITFGKWLVNAVKFAVQFSAGAIKAFGKVIGFLVGLPGKAVSALGDLGDLLKDAGGRLIGGFIDGMKKKLGKVKEAAKSVAGVVKGFFPGSPVREGPLKSWNRGGAGTRLVGMLADGLGNTGPVDTAVRGLASRVQVTAPSLEPSVSGATFGSSGGREIRGTLSLDRQGVATIHGVAHDASESGHKQRDAAARNAAMGSESFR